MAFRKRWFRLSQRLIATAKAKAFRRSSNDSVVAVTSFALSGGTPKRIMVFGDSNAFRPGGGRTCWPVLLEDKDSDHLHVFNESCKGRTTQYDTGERNGLGVIRDKLAAYTPLDYVIVMLGTNDMKSQYGPPRAADIADGIDQILDFIDMQGNGIEPILLTPPPLGDVTSGELAGAQARIPHVAVAYRLLAMKRALRLVDIHAILDSHTDLEADRIHLNAVGRQKVADAVWANLQDVTASARVTGFCSLPKGADFNLTWNAVGADTFYYCVRKNGDIIGRTMNTSFMVTAPAIGDHFTVEAVDFSQNTGPASTTITYNEERAIECKLQNTLNDNQRKLPRRSQELVMHR